MVKVTAAEVNKLRNQGYTIEQAVHEMAKKGQLKPIKPESSGKIARSDISNVNQDPEAVYDQLLVTGYDSELLNDSKAVKFGNMPRSNADPRAADYSTDKLAVAPETIHMVNLPQLRKAIDSGKINTTIFSNRNKGVSGTGYVRDKLQEIIPQNKNPYITDLTVSHPFTQQLLANLQYQ